MILKIAHVCLGDASPSVRPRLEREGYSLVFAERVRAMTIARAFLSRPVTEFSIALWTRPGSISIEVLEFTRTSSNPGRLTPVIAGPSGNADASFLDYPAIQIQSLSAVPAVFNAVEARTTDLPRSIRYWQALGFEPADETNGGGGMSLRSRLGGEVYRLLLRRDDDPVAHGEEIDSPGFHLVGLASSAIAEDRARLRAAGGEPTPTEQIDVNGRRLEIFYARSPEGLVTEVISFV